MPIPRKPISHMPNSGQQRYVINKNTLEKIKDYQLRISSGAAQPGKHLLAEMNHFLTEGKEEYEPNSPLSGQELSRIGALHPAAFMQLIMNTREPIIFAENQQIGDGKKWNKDEYEILGNVCSVLKGVQVYDNGKYGGSNTGDARYKKTLLK